MALAQGSTGGAYALTLAIIIAVIYLSVVRFMDLNEKEPLWAMGMIFFLGAITAAILPLLVTSQVLELNAFWGPVAEELAKFVALALGMVALGAAARSRGWSEISDVMDGIVYGTALGFGYATGAIFVRELTFGGTFVTIGPFGTLWSNALLGLSDGLFGAIVGAGFGAAVVARSTPLRVAYPIAGLVGAILAHVVYRILAEGNALGGSSALARTWIALLIPIVFVAAVVITSLVGERRAIQEQLASESESGAVTEDELAVLQSFARRRGLYTRALLSMDFDRWLALRELHNRQVQLALAKRRESRESDPEHRAHVAAEVQHLRASVLAMKHQPESSSSARPSGPGAADA